MLKVKIVKPNGAHNWMRAYSQADAAKIVAAASRNGCTAKVVKVQPR